MPDPLQLLIAGLVVGAVPAGLLLDRPAALSGAVVEQPGLAAPLALGERPAA